MNKQKHAWVNGQVKLLNGKHKNRRKRIQARSGKVCAGCRLVALPPTKGAEQWTPPAGECQL